MSEFEVVEHVAVDAHRRLEARAAQHYTVAGRRNLRAGKIGLQPGEDEVHRRPVINRMAVAPFMRVHRLAGRVLDDEMRIALHAVDPAQAKQRQRRRLVHGIGAKLQTGGARVEDDDGLAHGGHSAVSGSRMVGSRASASA